MVDAREGRTTDLSVMSRVIAGVRYALTGTTPDAWFGPGQPIPPVAQQVQGRLWDYPAALNMQTQPRINDPVKFSDLRALADGCDIVRMAIETRKDQIGTLKWDVVASSGETVANDARITLIKTFFKRPDRNHDWHTWLRMLLEDLLVIDAPTVYIRLTNGNKPFSLDVIDGSTIKRVIDEQGRTPAAPDPAYQQILHGVVAADYSCEELLYLPRNVRAHKMYGYSPVEQIIFTINTLIRKEIFQQQYFTEGSLPDAIIGVPPTWNPDQIKSFEAYFNDQLSGNTSERRKVRFVADGVNYTPTKTEPLKDDFDEWLVRIVCYAFSLPPSAFVKQMNRATQEAAQNTAIEEGLAPLKQWVKELMDTIITQYFEAPDLEFCWVDQKEEDPLVRAQINQLYVNVGVLTPNEIRLELGLDPLKEPVKQPAQEDGAVPVAPGKEKNALKKKVL